MARTPKELLKKLLADHFYLGQRKGGLRFNWRDYVSIGEIDEKLEQELLPYFEEKN